ncbi:hypothetical protein ACI2L1_39340 [Streptomyces sp. NPDC019531]|uniref:hypothetical protein n=1 Tax=Streptomyces sp. NPDC019531 TaxID=3365062 RepID=UPI00385110CD
MSSARRPRYGRTWLRTLVLLLALLVPAAPMNEAHGVGAGEIVEYDVLDTAVRPPARVVHRTAARLRTAPRSEAAPAVPAHRPVPGSPQPPYAPPAPRSVVLRC